MIYLIIIFILIFLPFPLVINVNYMNNELFVFLFKFKIYPNKHIESNKNIKRKIKEKKGKLNFFKNKNKYISLLIRLKDNYFKPTLKFNMNLVYGIDDAATTAILNGIIWSFSSVLYNIFNDVFKIKKFNFNTQPEFNKTTLNINLKCIFFINIVKITYIVFLIKSTLKPKQTKNINIEEAI